MSLRMGMLWFDDTPNRPLAEKITRAAQYYQAKYGRAPDTCYISQSDQEDLSDADAPPGLGIRPMPDVLPHHFWLGNRE